MQQIKVKFNNRFSSYGLHREKHGKKGLDQNETLEIELKWKQWRLGELVLNWWEKGMNGME